tara:strand:+ start:2144 stop:2842 length:699 start_codon:yes stop_codon:yes gene_type:complete
MKIMNVNNFKYIHVFFTSVMCLCLLILLGCSGNMRTGDVEIAGGLIKAKGPAFPESGAHKVEIFTEMHYQPSYKSQEPSRILPPPNSVPVTGKEISYKSLEDYNNYSPNINLASNDLELGQQLYTINCLVCHGASLKGIDEIQIELKATILTLNDVENNPLYNRGPYPANLLSEVTTNSTDGEIFAFISWGGRQGFAAREKDKASNSPMPQFYYMLSETERWALVNYIRSFQ